MPVDAESTTAKAEATKAFRSIIYAFRGFDPRRKKQPYNIHSWAVGRR